MAVWRMGREVLAVGLLLALPLASGACASAPAAPAAAPLAPPIAEGDELDRALARGGLLGVLNRIDRDLGHDFGTGKAIDFAPAAAGAKATPTTHAPDKTPEQASGTDAAETPR